MPRIEIVCTPDTKIRIDDEEWNFPLHVDAAVIGNVKLTKGPPELWQEQPGTVAMVPLGGIGDPQPYMAEIKKKIEQARKEHGRWGVGQVLKQNHIAIKDLASSIGDWRLANELGIHQNTVSTYVNKPVER